MFLFGCSTKPPTLEKYGWNQFENIHVITKFIEDELCHSDPEDFKDKLWYVSNKQDYLICDKKPLSSKHFCRGYTICYNMGESYDCGFVVPFRNWKGNWEKNRPKKLTDEQKEKQKIENEKAGIGSLGIKSCEEQRLEKLQYDQNS